MYCEEHGKQHPHPKVKKEHKIIICNECVEYTFTQKILRPFNKILGPFFPSLYKPCYKACEVDLEDGKISRTYDACIHIWLKMFEDNNIKLDHLVVKVDPNALCNGQSCQGNLK